MADPLSNKIVKVLRARLQMISVANGYETDAGAMVRHGRLKIDAPDLHLAVHAGTGTEKEDPGRNRIDVNLHVLIHGWVPVPDTETAGEITELVIGDVQKAVEKERQRALADDGDGPLARDLIPLGRLTLAPVRGADKSASRNDEFTLTYQVSYTRRYGSPGERA